ncbi:MAG: hypothetical protein ACI9ES_002116 [Oceanospirillaceae bacterium]|jgi:hypothetical protein
MIAIIIRDYYSFALINPAVNPKFITKTVLVLNISSLYNSALFFIELKTGNNKACARLNYCFNSSCQ